jgi:hypothetical protein
MLATACVCPTRALTRGVHRRRRQGSFRAPKSQIADWLLEHDLKPSGWLPGGRLARTSPLLPDVDDLVEAQDLEHPAH